MNSRAETYAAIRKLLATLDDPFTRFLEPARLDALRKGTKGVYILTVYNAQTQHVPF
jgi:C-terminal processing protease CtpA/Prc